MSTQTPSNGLQRKINSIFGRNPDETMQKRMAYYQAGMARQEFIDGILNLKGKQYSDAVVSFDKTALQASV